MRRQVHDEGRVGDTRLMLFSVHEPFSTVSFAVALKMELRGSGPRWVRRPGLLHVVVKRILIARIVFNITPVRSMSFRSLVPKHDSEI